MTERIYDALKALLFVQLPKNSRGQPVIYDRIIKNWYTGERQVVPDNITVLISGGSVSESDYSWGYRQVEYDFKIKLYVTGDDQLITLRIATEGARLIRNILNQHKRIWVMDLCPVCGKLPTSPEHFFLDSSHTNVFGNYGDENGPTGAAGAAFNAFANTWYSTHPSLSLPGNLSQVAVITSGSGYVTAPLIYINGGGYGASGATALAYITSGSLSSIDVNNIGTCYTATPTVAVSGSGEGAVAQAIIAKPSDASIASQAFYKVLADYKNGIIPASLTSAQKQRFSELIRDGVYPARVLYDVQIQSVVPTDESEGKALRSTSEISIKCKEIMPVERFGPNYSGSIYNPREAL
jgi:hypothetical protein